MNSINTSPALFLLTNEDAQISALQLVGRRLSDDELHSVKKYVESGLECWSEVLKLAIEEATRC